MKRSETKRNEQHQPNVYISRINLMPGRVPKQNEY